MVFVLAVSVADDSKMQQPLRQQHWCSGVMSLNQTDLLRKVPVGQRKLQEETINTPP